jgi:ATP-dependent Clp protease ATP-binding subunit ClpX
MVQQRVHGNVQLDDDPKNTAWHKDVLPGDIAKFGLIPEFVGRLPVIVCLTGLDADALITILTVPKNAIVSQYKTMFELDGIALEFEHAALERVAEKALQLKTGARGLRTVMEAVMREVMYKAPGEKFLRKVTITEGVVTEGKEATLDYTYARQGNEPWEPQPKAPRSRTAI